MLAEAPRPWFKEAPRPWFKEAPPPWFRHAPRASGGIRSASCRLATSPREAFRAAQYDALIREVAGRHRIDSALVKAVIKAESDFDPRAVSPAGARGLMQLMPATADDLSVCDAFHPRDNIEGGCQYLRELLDRYDGNLVLALAAYNAGMRRVDDAGGVPAIAETREYLERVLRYRIAYEREAGAGHTKDAGLPTP